MLLMTTIMMTMMCSYAVVATYAFADAYNDDNGDYDGPNNIISPLVLIKRHRLCFLITCKSVPRCMKGNSARLSSRGVYIAGAAAICSLWRLVLLQPLEYFQGGGATGGHAPCEQVPSRRGLPVQHLPGHKHALRQTRSRAETKGCEELL